MDTRDKYTNRKPLIFVTWIHGPFERICIGRTSGSMVIVDAVNAVAQAVEQFTA